MICTSDSPEKLLWNVSYPQFGQSWSAPVVSRIDINDGGLNTDKAVVVVGGGYDPVHDSKTHPLTLDAEGLGAPSDADTRRFYNSPDVSIFTDRNQNRRFVSLSIGSGYRAHPLDNGAADRFYSVRDPNVFNQLTQAAYDSFSVITDADLVEVSGQVRTIIDPAKKGWKFKLSANQKIVADSITFDDSVFFVGFSAESNLADICQPSQGQNFLYQVRVENGDPVVNNLDSLLPEDADTERVTALAQGGIAPSPVFLFPNSTDPDCSGADCAPPPIACVGVECFDPGFVNYPVRTLWTQDGIE